MRSDEEFKALVLQKCDKMYMDKIKKVKKVTALVSLGTCICLILSFSVLYFYKNKYITETNRYHLTENENKTSKISSQSPENESYGVEKPENALSENELSEKLVLSEIKDITIFINQKNVTSVNTKIIEAYTDFFNNSQKTEVKDIPESIDIQKENFTVTITLKNNEEYTHEWYGNYCLISKENKQFEITSKDKETLSRFIKDIYSETSDTE